MSHWTQTATTRVLDIGMLAWPIRELRGLQGVIDLHINRKPTQFDSSTARLGPWPNVVMSIDLDALNGQPIDVQIGQKLVGTASLQLLPLARSTT